MTVNLGPRQPSYPTRHPCYGKGAVIEGVATIRNFKHLKEASVNILGVASVVYTDRNYPIFQNGRLVLLHTMRLYSAKKKDPRPTSPLNFPISFPIPAYVRRAESIMPPSTSAKYGNIEIEVRYSINISVTKFGLYRHEYASTPIFYLPRSAPTSLRSLAHAYEELEAKAEVTEEVNWRMVDARPQPPEGALGTIVQLGLIKPLSYKGGTAIPWRVVIASSAPLTEELLRASISLKIVRAMAITFGNQRARMERDVATGEIWKIDAGDGNGVWEVTGAMTTDKGVAEISWSVEHFVESRHIVRLTIKSMAGLPEYHRDDLIQLVTDDSEDLMVEESRETPALGLLAAASGGTTPGIHI